MRTTEEYETHRAEIARIVAMWQAGKISTSTKRAAIAQENEHYYGVTGTRLTTEPQLADDVAHVIAAGTGQNLGKVSAQLNARRLAGYRDANRDSSPRWDRSVLVRDARRLREQAEDLEAVS
jgi:hypothetical protein